jgi:hypothetical protein
MLVDNRFGEDLNLLTMPSFSVSPSLIVELAD